MIQSFMEQEVDGPDGDIKPKSNIPSGRGIKSEAP